MGRARLARCIGARDRGAVAVEFALVLPVLAMLLLGVVTAGIALSNSIGLTNAVREGARFGAITPYPPASGNWADDVVQRTRDTQFDDPSIQSKVCVDLVKQGSPDVSQQSDCDGGLAATPPAFSPPSTAEDGTCVVRVWAAREFTINGVLFSFDRVMTRQSIAVYERDPCGS